jgi:hypothetical protein
VQALFGSTGRKDIDETELQRLVASSARGAVAWGISLGRKAPPGPFQ